MAKAPRWRRSFVPTLGVIVLGLGLGLGTAACSRSPQMPPGWTTESSQAFQAEHAAEIATPTGPLSTVASHYVGMGHSLTLGIVDGAVVTDPPHPGPEQRVRVDVTDKGPRCVEGCGPTPVMVTKHEQVAFGRFTFTLSPQSGTLRILVHDAESPALHSFKGLAWFPVDARFIVPARWEPAAQPTPVELSTSRGLTKSFVRAGTLHAQVQGQDIALIGYQAGPDALLVPVTDETTGNQTYPVGRYLEVPVPKDGLAALDFNRATNPWCAYSEHYNCPVPPTENAVPLAIEAGEKIYAAH